MQKIPSLYKRDYAGNRLVYDEVVPGCEWVLAGEGVATVKVDGTCCLVRDGKLYKRFDRKVSKAAQKRQRQDSAYQFKPDDYKDAPEGWQAAQDPDPVTGHWPGWLLVGDGPEDQYHREGFANFKQYGEVVDSQTYELIGPKIQGNPYHLDYHTLQRHGFTRLNPEPGRNFVAIRAYLEKLPIEGIVWHHPDGRMAKIKRKDFGFNWPIPEDK